MGRFFMEGLRSLRGKIILSFLFIIGVLMLWTASFFYVNSQRARLRHSYESIYRLQNSCQQSTEKLLSFMFLDYQKPSFYKDYGNAGIDEFVSEFNMYSDSLEEIEVYAASEVPQTVSLIRELKSRMVSITDTVKVMRHIYFKRGFRDYGLEGEMRIYAHLLQESKLIPEVDILSLRRHEKDFLLRNDGEYVEKFNQRAEKVLSTLKSDSKSSAIFVKYVSLFNQLVELSTILGNMDGNGMNGYVKSAEMELGVVFKKTTDVFQMEIQSRYKRFDLLLFAVSIGSVLLLVFISIWLSGYLTKDVKALNQRMFSFINSRFTEDGTEEMDFKKSGIREVNQLNRMYDLLKSNLKETITDLEATAKKAEQASEFKSFFLANMSHEIRTPLNGVIGMLHVLKSTNLDSQQREVISTIDYSSNHLLELVNMVLDYSKIEAGKMELKPAPFNLEKELKMLVKSFKPKLEEKKLTLNFFLDFDHSHLVIGDIIRIQQVLINLLNNAVKFSSEGVITFHVQQIKETESSQSILFKIEDQGIGITEEKLADIFKAFHQGDVGISREYGGTGLGLAISQQIVKLMGGEIKVTSVVGKGSAFYFVLDFPFGSLISQPRPNEKDYPERNQKLNVLVAEDNQINQRVFELLFSTRNIELDMASNGLEALDFFAKKNYDLVFLDLQMPLMDGFKTIEEIKRHPKIRMKTIGIYAVSANAFEEDQNKAIQAGFDGFISKPIILEELDHVLSKYRRIAFEEYSEWR